MQRTVLHSDDRSDDPKPVSPRRIELFTGAPGRRRWLNELKARIVVESFAPDAVVTQIAQRHGCRPQQIHDWRHLARTGLLALPMPDECNELPAFVPVVAAGTSDAPHTPCAPQGALEVEIAGATVRIQGHPGVAALRRSVQC